VSTDTAPRTGPALAQTTKDGRWYDHPTTGERFISITTALRSVNKKALVFWAAGLAAQSALDELPRLISATLTKPCERTFNRCQHDWQVRCVECPCGQCPPCVGKWLRDRHIAESSRRVDEGTRVHDVIEHWVLSGGEALGHDEDIDPYVEQFWTFIADYGLTPDSWQMSEATVINRDYGYAGTLDQIIEFKADASPKAAELCARVALGAGSVLLLGDNKTREDAAHELNEKKAAFYPDHALQCAAYRNATAVLLPDGQEEPLPRVGGAFILQLRPDGYELRLVVADDRTFGAFLSVLALAKWQWEYATASVSTKAFPKPRVVSSAAVLDPSIPLTGTGRSAKAAPAKKTTARKATAPREPKPTSATLSDTAKLQSATLRSMLGKPDPHPDSPFGDFIPF